MAVDKKFTDLVEETSPSSNDLLATNDVETGTSRRMKLGTLAAWLAADTIVHYKEVGTAFNSGGAGAFSPNGISALSASFTIGVAGIYDISLLLPAVYAQATTTQYHLRVTTTGVSATLLNTDTGSGVAPVAFASQPVPHMWRQRVSLAPGTYTTVFEWYGNTAGAGNPIIVGAGTNQVATFMVKKA